MFLRGIIIFFTVSQLADYFQVPGRGCDRDEKLTGGESGVIKIDKYQ
jgi:hypothetical protein